jgi:hypothetical protein
MMQQQPAPSTVAQAPPAFPVPQNSTEMTVAHVRRNELRSQLEALTDRREELASQLEDTHNPAARADLETRIRQVDSRSAQLDGDIQRADQAISEALARGVGVEAGTQVSVSVPDAPPTIIRTGVDEDFFGAMMFGMVMTCVVVATYVHRRAWRRAERKFTGAAGDSAQVQQVQQLQQAVDVIAVEVERIAEGQRFVSKLLSERLASPAEAERVLASKSAEPPRKR